MPCLNQSVKSGIIAIARSNATRQSRATHTTLDCHVADAPRNDGGIDTSPYSRDAFRPSFASFIALEKHEGTGKAGWPHAPGAPAQGKLRERALTTGTAETLRPSLRSGLRLTSCSSR